MPLAAAKSGYSLNRRASAKIDAIIKAFDAIGVVEPTREQRRRRNSVAVARGFYEAVHLAKLAEARKRQAIAADSRPPHKFTASLVTQAPPIKTPA